MLGRMLDSDPDKRPTIEEAAFVINALASGSIKEAPVKKKDPLELTGDFIGRHHIQKFIKQLVKENPNELSGAKLSEVMRNLSLYEQGSDNTAKAFHALKDLGVKPEHLLNNPELEQEFLIHFGGNIFI